MDKNVLEVKLNNFIRKAKSYNDDDAVLGGLVRDRFMPLIGALKALVSGTKLELPVKRPEIYYAIKHESYDEILDGEEFAVGVGKKFVIKTMRMDTPELLRLLNDNTTDDISELLRKARGVNVNPESDAAEMILRLCLRLGQLSAKSETPPTADSTD